VDGGDKSKEKEKKKQMQRIVESNTRFAGAVDGVVKRKRKNNHGVCTGNSFYTCLGYRLFFHSSTSPGKITLFEGLFFYSLFVSNYLKTYFFSRLGRFWTVYHRMIGRETG
jgi:hypothetical protein